jgi:hypothetical protein
MRQLPQGFFLENVLFFKNAWHFKDIITEFEAFLKISIFFKTFSEKLRLFLINVRVFQRFRVFLNTFLGFFKVI